MLPERQRYQKMDGLPRIESRILNQGLSLERGLGARHNMH